MSLIDTASLIVTPNGYKEGKLYSVIPSDGSGDMSVVRATTATRVNSAGLVELVPYNLVTYSEQFNNADWGKEFTTITANNITAPDGMLTADRFNLSSGTEQKFLYQGATQNGTYTQSVYFKKGTHTFVQLAVGGDVNPYCNFDLTNGTFSAFGSTATMTNVGDGWYRCTMTYTSSVATYFYIFASDSLSSARTASTSSTGNFYAWGAQLNEGTLKDYQKTETRLNIPRLDYSNGTCPSLLVEPQRTNLYAWSSSFDNAVWNTGNATITANTTISPSGIQDADSIFEQAVNDYQIDGQLYSMTNGVTYTMSIYVKANTRQYFRALVGNSVLINFQSAYFDLVNGVSTSTSLITTTMTDAGNGWWKCSLTFTCNNTATDAIYFGSSPNMTSAYSPFVGDPTKGVFIWGAQLEAGSYPTSYIPTTSASVTRNADVISKTGISSLIGQTEGVIFIDAYRTQKSVNYQALIGLGNGTSSSEMMEFYYKSSNELTVGVYNSGQQFVNNTVIANGRHKIALAYKANDFALYIDGVLIASDTSGTVPTMNQLNIGEFNYTSGYAYADGINAVALWKTRLTNTQLAQLTTI